MDSITSGTVRQRDSVSRRAGTEACSRARRYSASKCLIKKHHHHELGTVSKRRVEESQFWDPQFRVPRRPLVPGRVYHFNVIYNHDGSPVLPTEDSGLALRVTTALVERLELRGYVNSYYHHRDHRSTNSLETELDRVLAGSSATILLLTPDFISGSLNRYLNFRAFRRLLGQPCASLRLLILSVGVPRERVPAQLCPDLVFYFHEHWEIDVPTWNRFDYVMLETLASPANIFRLCDDAWDQNKYASTATCNSAWNEEFMSRKRLFKETENTKLSTAGPNIDRVDCEAIGVPEKRYEYFCRNTRNECNLSYKRDSVTFSNDHKYKRMVIPDKTSEVSFLTSTLHYPTEMYHSISNYDTAHTDRNSYRQQKGIYNCHHLEAFKNHNCAHDFAASRSLDYTPCQPRIGQLGHCSASRTQWNELQEEAVSREHNTVSPEISTTPIYKHEIPSYRLDSNKKCSYLQSSKEIFADLAEKGITFSDRFYFSDEKCISGATHKNNPQTRTVSLENLPTPTSVDRKSAEIFSPREDLTENVRAVKWTRNEEMNHWISDSIPSYIVLSKNDDNLRLFVSERIFGTSSVSLRGQQFEDHRGKWALDKDDKDTSRQSRGLLEDSQTQDFDKDDNKWRACMNHVSWTSKNYLQNFNSESSYKSHKETLDDSDEEIFDDLARRTAANLNKPMTGNFDVWTPDVLDQVTSDNPEEWISQNTKEETKITVPQWMADSEHISQCEGNMLLTDHTEWNSLDELFVTTCNEGSTFETEILDQSDKSLDQSDILLDQSDIPLDQSDKPLDQSDIPLDQTDKPFNLVNTEKLTMSDLRDRKLSTEKYPCATAETKMWLKPNSINENRIESDRECRPSTKTVFQDVNDIIITDKSSTFMDRSFLNYKQQPCTQASTVESIRKNMSETRGKESETGLTRKDIATEKSSLSIHALADHVAFDQDSHLKYPSGISYVDKNWFTSIAPAGDGDGKDESDHVICVNTSQTEIHYPEISLPETSQAEISLPETNQAEISLTETSQSETSQFESLPETSQAKICLTEISLPETSQSETSQAEKGQAESLPETSQAEISLTETTQAEISLTETSQFESLPETCHAEISLTEKSQAEISLTETTQAEISLTETSQAEISLTETSQSETSQAEKGQAESLPETSQAESLTETSQAETSQFESLHETSQAEISLPETSQAEIGLTETTQAEISLTETSQAEISLTETSQAETSQSETSQAEISLPETSQIEISKPDINLNKGNEPEMTGGNKPEISQQEISQSELSMYKKSHVEINQPQTSRLEISQPEINLPEINQHEISQPEINLPEINQPEISQPEINLPEINQHEISQPEINLPEINQPEISQPEINLPEINQPEISQPEINLPEINQHEISQPEINLPEINQPEILPATSQLSNSQNWTRDSQSFQRNVCESKEQHCHIQPLQFQNSLETSTNSYLSCDVGFEATNIPHKQSKMSPTDTPDSTSKMSPTDNSDSTSKMSPTDNSDSTSKMSPTDNSDSTSKMSPTDNSDSTSKMSPTDNSASTSKMSPTDNSDSTSKMSPTDNSASTSKMSPTDNSDSTSKMSPTDNSDSTSKMSPTDNSDSTSKMSPTDNSDSTSKMSPTDNSDSTSKMSPTDNSASTSKMSPTDNSDSTSKMSPTDNSDSTSKMSPTDNSASTSKMSPTDNSDSTSKMSPTDNSDSTSKMSPTDNSDSTSKMPPTDNSDSTSKMSPTDNSDSTSKMPPTDNSDSTSKMSPTDTPESTSKMSPTDNSDSTSKMSPTDNSDSTSKMSPTDNPDSTSKMPPTDNPESTSKMPPTDNPDSTSKMPPTDNHESTSKMPPTDYPDSTSNMSSTDNLYSTSKTARTNNLTFTPVSVEETVTLLNDSSSQFSLGTTCGQDQVDSAELMTSSHRQVCFLTNENGNYDTGFQEALSCQYNQTERNLLVSKDQTFLPEHKDWSSLHTEASGETMNTSQLSFEITSITENRFEEQSQNGKLGKDGMSNYWANCMEGITDERLYTPESGEDLSNLQEPDHYINLLLASVLSEDDLLIYDQQGDKAKYLHEKLLVSHGARYEDLLEDSHYNLDSHRVRAEDTTTNLFEESLCNIDSNRFIDEDTANFITSGMSSDIMESKNDAAYDKLEKMSNNKNIEDNTDLTTFSDDKEDNTDLTTLSDDKEDNTDLTTFSDDKEDNTDLTTFSDDKEDNTDLTTLSDDKEDNTDLTTFSDDKEDNTDLTTFSDDKEDNTDLTTLSDDKEDNTDLTLIDNTDLTTLSKYKEDNTDLTTLSKYKEDNTDQSLEGTTDMTLAKECIEDNIDRTVVFGCQEDNIDHTLVSESREENAALTLFSEGQEDNTDQTLGSECQKDNTDQTLGSGCQEYNTDQTLGSGCQEYNTDQTLGSECQEDNTDQTLGSEYDEYITEKISVDEYLEDKIEQTLALEYEEVNIEKTPFSRCKEDDTDHALLFNCEEYDTGQILILEFQEDNTNQTIFSECHRDSTDQTSVLECHRDSTDQTSVLECHRDSTDQTSVLECHQDSTDQTSVLECYRDSTDQTSVLECHRDSTDQTSVLECHRDSTDQTSVLECYRDSPDQTSVLECHRDSTDHINVLECHQDSTDQTSVLECHQDSTDQTSVLECHRDSTDQTSVLECHQDSIDQTSVLECHRDSTDQINVLECHQDSTEKTSVLKYPQDRTAHISVLESQKDYTAPTLVERIKDTNNQPSVMECKEDTTEQTVVLDCKKEDIIDVTSVSECKENITDLRSDSECHEDNFGLTLVSKFQEDNHDLTSATECQEDNTDLTSAQDSQEDNTDLTSGSECQEDSTDLTSAPECQEDNTDLTSATECQEEHHDLTLTLVFKFQEENTNQASVSTCHEDNAHLKSISARNEDNTDEASLSECTTDNNLIYEPSDDNLELCITSCVEVKETDVISSGNTRLDTRDDCDVEKSGDGPFVPTNILTTTELHNKGCFEDENASNACTTNEVNVCDDQLGSEVVGTPFVDLTEDDEDDDQTFPYNSTSCSWRQSIVDNHGWSTGQSCSYELSVVVQTSQACNEEDSGYFGEKQGSLSWKKDHSEMSMPSISEQTALKKQIDLYEQTHLDKEANFDNMADLDKETDLDILTDLDKVVYLDNMTHLDKVVYLDNMTDLDKETDLDKKTDLNIETSLDNETDFDKQNYVGKHTNFNYKQNMHNGTNTVTVGVPKEQETTPSTSDQSDEGLEITEQRRFTSSPRLDFSTTRCGINVQEAQSSAEVGERCNEEERGHGEMHSFTSRDEFPHESVELLKDLDSLQHKQSKTNEKLKQITEFCVGKNINFRFDGELTNEISRQANNQQTFQPSIINISGGSTFSFPAEFVTQLPIQELGSADNDGVNEIVEYTTTPDINVRLPVSNVKVDLVEYLSKHVENEESIISTGGAVICRQVGVQILGESIQDKDAAFESISAVMSASVDNTDAAMRETNDMCDAGTGSFDETLEGSRTAVTFDLDDTTINKTSEKTEDTPRAVTGQVKVFSAADLTEGGSCDMSGPDVHREMSTQTEATETKSPGIDGDNDVDSADNHEKVDWKLPVFKGVCHMMSNPDMPYLG